MDFSKVTDADWLIVVKMRQKTERIRDEWEADEEYDESRWMGSDSDFSDHALGIDY